MHHCKKTLRPLVSTHQIITFLIAGAVATLPFTYALTIDIGFPLKAYELLLTIAFIFSLLVTRIKASRHFYIAVGLASILWLVAMVSLVFRLVTVAGPDVIPGARFGAEGDGIAKLLYLAFAVFSYGLIYLVARDAPRLLVRAWLFGSTVAASYLFYTVASMLIGVDPILLPGMERLQAMTVNGIVFVRSGTFEEGNFGALYFTFSVALCLAFRRYVLAAFLTGAALLTLSTIGLVALSIVIVLWLAVPGESTPKAVRVAWVGGTSLLLVTFIASGYLDFIAREKFSLENPGSFADRAHEMSTAWAMFQDRPILGVGLGQYGYRFAEYDRSDVEQAVERDKRIPNNVYLEILSETGVFGAAAFIGLLLVWLRQSMRKREYRPLAYAGFASLVVLNAFPTFTLLYLWAFWAIAGALNDGAQESAVNAGGTGQLA